MLACRVAVVCAAASSLQGRELAGLLLLKVLVYWRFAIMQWENRIYCLHNQFFFFEINV